MEIIKPQTFIAVDNARFEGSTLLVISAVYDGSEFYVALGHKQCGEDKPIGYLKFEFIHHEHLNQTFKVSNFVLTQVLAASAPPPHPIVALSNVLWSPTLFILPQHHHMHRPHHRTDQNPDIAPPHAKIIRTRGQ